MGSEHAQEPGKRRVRMVDQVALREDGLTLRALVKTLPFVTRPQSINVLLRELLDTRPGRSSNELSLVPFPRGIHHRHLGPQLRRSRPRTVGTKALMVTFQVLAKVARELRDFRRWVRVEHDRIENAAVRPSRLLKTKVARGGNVKREEGHYGPHRAYSNSGFTILERFVAFVACFAVCPEKHEKG